MPAEKPRHQRHAHLDGGSVAHREPRLPPSELADCKQRDRDAQDSEECPVGQHQHQLCRERDHRHQKEVQPPEGAQAHPRGTDAIPESLKQVRDKHWHDQYRHRHVIGHERPCDAQRDQRQRKADYPLGKAASRHRHGRPCQWPGAIRRVKTFEPCHAPASRPKASQQAKRQATLIKFRPRPTRASAFLRPWRNRPSFLRSCSNRFRGATSCRARGHR